MRETRTILTILACAFLLTLAQLVAGLTNLLAGIISGVVLVVVGRLLLAFFQIEVRAGWVHVLLPTASSALGVAGDFLARPDQALRLWLAPVLAFALSLAILGVERLRSKRCALCNRRLGSGPAFICPRCFLVVCDHTCWIFEHGRCRLCEQNRVPIFSPDGRWWDKQFGPRTPHGRCQLCMVAALEADLRACRNCGRPQCRDCWDFANGQCSRCNWMVDDLPEALQAYIIAPAKSVQPARVSPPRG